MGVREVWGLLDSVVRVLTGEKAPLGLERVYGRLLEERQEVRE